MTAPLEMCLMLQLNQLHAMAGEMEIELPKLGARRASVPQFVNSLEELKERASLLEQLVDALGADEGQMPALA